MGDILAWSFIILVAGGLVVGIIGLVLPLVLVVAGWALATFAFAVLARIVGRILS